MSIGFKVNFNNWFTVATSPSNDTVNEFWRVTCVTGEEGIAFYDYFTEEQAIAKASDIWHRFSDIEVYVNKYNEKDVISVDLDGSFKVKRNKDIWYNNNYITTHKHVIGDLIKVCNPDSSYMEEAIFIAYIENNESPFLCVRSDSDMYYKANKHFSTSMYKYDSETAQYKPYTEEDMDLSWIDSNVVEISTGKTYTIDGIHKVDDVPYVYIDYRFITLENFCDNFRWVSTNLNCGRIK